MKAYPEFAGATVLVTGAGAGIGRAIARAFLSQGARVAGLDINRDGLADSMADVPAERTCALFCDLSDEAAVRGAFATVVEQLGPPAILVNNAGAADSRPFEQMTMEEWRHELARNLDHHFLLSQLAAPHMRRAGQGTIVGISSHAWMKMAPDLAAYHAAKAGIVGLMRGLARELGRDFVRVNAIAPGRVFTDALHAGSDGAYVDETKRLQCLPILIMPDDIANTVLWLCSGRARAITGQVIVVDGGWV